MEHLGPEPNFVATHPPPFGFYRSHFGRIQYPIFRLASVALLRTPQALREGCR